MVAGLAVAIACGPARPTAAIELPHATDTLLNPERGFVVDVDLVGGRDFAYVRAQGCTLGYAGVRLDAYRDQPLPPELLQALGAGFEAARNAGIKVVLRFAYNHAGDGADAPKAQILAHLAQLAPVLAANADVIAVMDAGFIGAWGEWHSSTSGLDNPRDRNDILAAILAALPRSRSVTVRRPMYKLDASGGPVTAATAFGGMPVARIGHLNSCFLASDTDLGTYPDPVDRWKSFVAEDGRFVPVGGETCQLNPPRTDCPTALDEIARLHWSFMNALYRGEVLAAWQAQGCYQRIARDLGYRFELTAANVDARVAPGGILHVAFSITNTGAAALYNPRPVFVTFDEQSALTTLDPRRWEPGQTAAIALRLRIPGDARPGAHRIGLWLPDADPRLRQPGRVALFSVRFANTRWAAPYNLVTDDLIVDPAAPGPVDLSAPRLAVIDGD